MARRWWFSFDGMEEVAFKPRADGFVYCPPNPWLFGRNRYYLVNEAQKSDLARLHRRMLLVMFWMIVGGGADRRPFGRRVRFHPTVDHAGPGNADRIGDRHCR